MKRIFLIVLVGMLLGSASNPLGDMVPVKNYKPLSIWKVANYTPPRLVFVFDLKTLFPRLGIVFLLILGLGFYMGRILHRSLLAEWPVPWNKPDPFKVV